MSRSKGSPGAAGALLALFLLAGAAAPWWAAALALTAPAVPADAADPMEEPAVPPQNPDGPGPKLIALTFDDGPRRATTSALLDGLAERGVRATFFLIGRQMENHEDLIRRMDQEGHQVGIHTDGHVKLTGLSKADFDAQVSPTRRALTDLLGHGGFLLRPPYGLTDEAVRRNAGCPIILWSIDPEDWRDQNAARVVEHVTSHARDGSIILMHDIFPSSVEAALQIVDRLHARGYLFVTVDELFAARQVSLEPGEIYRSAYP